MGARKGSQPTVQLKHLVTQISSLSDEELLERLRQIRHNREVLRPAAKDRARRAEVKVTTKKVEKLRDLLANLTEEERRQLLSQLGEEK